MRALLFFDFDLVSSFYNGSASGTDIPTELPRQRFRDRQGPLIQLGLEGLLRARCRLHIEARTGCVGRLISGSPLPH